MPKTLQVIDTKLMTTLRPLKNKLTIMALIIMFCGIVAAAVVRAVFARILSKTRRELVGIAGGVGVLFGLWLALKTLNL